MHLHESIREIVAPDKLELNRSARGDAELQITGLIYFRFWTIDFDVDDDATRRSIFYLFGTTTLERRLRNWDNHAVFNLALDWGILMIIFNFLVT